MSDGKITFELVSPERLLLKKEVEELTAPGSEGEFGILPGHRPFITLLKCGEVRYTISGEDSTVVVGGGFAEIADDAVKIMAETAEFPHEIDVERAQKAKSVAEDKIKELDRVKDEEEFALFQAKLERAVCRINVASGEFPQK